VATSFPIGGRGTRYLLVEKLHPNKTSDTKADGAFNCQSIKLHITPISHPDYLLMQKSSGIARCRSSRKVRLREQVHAINTNGSAIEAIFLEPFKPQIVTADSAGRIRVFDYLQAKLLNQFDATRDSTKVSAVRSMFRLNDLYNELLLACCRNGTVTVWRYFAKSGCEMPAASWQSIGTEV